MTSSCIVLDEFLKPLDSIRCMVFPKPKEKDGKRPTLITEWKTTASKKKVVLRAWKQKRKEQRREEKRTSNALQETALNDENQDPQCTDEVMSCDEDQSRNPSQSSLFHEQKTVRQNMKMDPPGSGGVIVEKPVPQTILVKNALSEDSDLDLHDFRFPESLVRQLMDDDWSTEETVQGKPVLTEDITFEDWDIFDDRNNREALE